MPRTRIAKFKDGRTIAANGMHPEDHDPDSNEGFYEGSGKTPPRRVDLRKHCTPVEDQAQTNSCCANAIAGAYEYILARHHAKMGEKPVDVSRLFIYYVGRKYDNFKKKKGAVKVKDAGMSIGGAIDAMHVSGVCHENVWPYDMDTVNATPSKLAFSDALNCKISASRRVAVNVDAMKEVLADGHVILTGLKLTKKFFNPGPSGKIDTPDPSDPKSSEHGLHAMLIVGYSDSSQVFIYRNSWGERWGDKGYGYVPYDYAANPKFNFCGQYAIMGLNDTDLRPEEDEDDDAPLWEEMAPGLDGEESDPESLTDGESSADEEDDEDDGTMFSQHKNLEKVFHKWDVNGSGNLRKFELLGALLNMGRRCPMKVVEQIQEQHDKDGINGTSFEEWCSINGCKFCAEQEAGRTATQGTCDSNAIENNEAAE